MKTAEVHSGKSAVCHCKACDQSRIDARISALEEAAEIALSCRTQDTIEREKFYAFACSKIRNFATKLKEGTE